MSQPEPSIYRLKIRLLQIEPPIWRRLEVSGGVDLEQLGSIIQTAMGWSGEHLGAFSIGGIEFTDPETVAELREDEIEAEVAEDFRLDAVLGRAGQRFQYDYDFADEWEHRIEIETIEPAEPGQRYPRCLAGERACPPEDIGGPEGYEAFLEAWRDPGQPDHRDARAYVAADYDPDRFDLAAAVQALAALG